MVAIPLLVAQPLLHQMLAVQDAVRSSAMLKKISNHIKLIAAQWTLP
jgi:hypothetical protein